MLATGPGQVWSWDITKLRGPAPGIWYNLYVIIDIFSRAMVGWLIADREDADLAEALFAKTYQRQGIRPRQLTVHADRGAPMRSNTLGALFQNLGVTAFAAQPPLLAGQGPPAARLDQKPGRLRTPTLPNFDTFRQPGYHLNKRHWITLTLDDTLDPALVQDLLDESYRLVVRSLPRATRERLLAM